MFFPSPVWHHSCNAVAAASCRGVFFSSWDQGDQGQSWTKQSTSWKPVMNPREPLPGLTCTFHLCNDRVSQGQLCESPWLTQPELWPEPFPTSLTRPENVLQQSPSNCAEFESVCSSVVKACGLMPRKTRGCNWCQSSENPFSCCHPWVLSVNWWENIWMLLF